MEQRWKWHSLVNEFSVFDVNRMTRILQEDLDDLRIVVEFIMWGCTCFWHFIIISVSHDLTISRFLIYLEAFPWFSVLEMVWELRWDAHHWKVKCSGIKLESGILHSDKGTADRSVKYVMTWSWGMDTSHLLLHHRSDDAHGRLERVFQVRQAWVKTSSATYYFCGLKLLTNI